MTRARHRRALAITAGVLAGAVTVTACSSGTAAGPSDTATPPASATAPSSTAPMTTATTATAPSSTAPASTSSATPTRSAATTEPARTAAPPVLRSTCTDVTVRVIRGSAAAGREFAALQFTNSGSSSCVLNGYPSVTLLRNGRTIGTASQPASSRTSTRTLAPGDTAESQLNDYTDCQAQLSDTIRVQVPGSSIVTERPGQLRACTLRTAPLAEPD